MPLIYELQQIGLSEKEAKVYLATLELTQATVQNISRKAKVNRTTVYVILEALIKKGLCSTYTQKKKVYYTATAPEFLESIFELQKEEIEERRKYFEKLLPQLNVIYNRQEGKPVVQFFEGREGIKNCVKEFLEWYREKNEKVIFIYSVDRLRSLFSDQERDDLKKIRSDKGIKSKVIYNFKNGELKNSSDGVRLKVSEEKYPLSADIAIYGDKLRLSSLGEKLSAILIQDKEIANTLKSLFELAWIGARAEAEKENKVP